MTMIGLLFAAQLAFGRDFQLMTVSPGGDFWSVYGHTALVINDEVFGFGVFSFEQEDFFQSFINNNMRYEMGITSLDQEVYWAEREGRDLWLTPLHLSEDAKEEIVQHLRWHWKEENRAYHYDYFANNCATKIRDLINRAVSGELENASTQTERSYFDMTFPVKNHSLMNLGYALAYGQAAYLPRSTWELMAFPMQLKLAVENTGSPKWAGKVEGKSLNSEQQADFSWWQTHAALVVLVSVWLLFLGIKKSRNLAASCWVWLSRVLALLLLSLSLFTAHDMAAWNTQLLLFLPWFFVKVPTAWYLLLVSNVLWFPLAIWQGSDYIWPLAMINLWVIWLKRP